MKFGVSALHVATHAGFAKAGISRYAIEWVAALARHGQENAFHVFPPVDFSMPLAWVDLPRLSVHPVRRTRTYLATLGMRSSFGGYDWWLNPAYDMLARSSVPEAAVIHDLYAITHPEWFDREHVEAAANQIERACREARLLFANSESTRQDILAATKRRPEDVVTIFCGPGNLGAPIDLDSLGPDAPRPHGVPEESYFLAVGTLEPRKNIPALLAGYRAFVSSNPDAPMLAIAGGKGWEFDPIFESLKTWDLESRVRFLGYVPDEAMPALYAYSEGFIFPSLGEGFGIPLLEAMIYGTPTACSDRGSLPEVAGDASYLFEPTSTEAIASAFGELIARSPTRSAWVARGRDQAAKFTWDQVADKTLRALEERS